MRNLKRVLFVMFALLLVLAILTFVLENQQPVSLLFLGRGWLQLPVSVIAVISLLMGMLIGPSAGWVVGRAGRTRRKRLG